MCFQGVKSQIKLRLNEVVLFLLFTPMTKFQVSHRLRLSFGERDNLTATSNHAEK